MLFMKKAVRKVIKLLEELGEDPLTIKRKKKEMVELVVKKVDEMRKELNEKIANWESIFDIIKKHTKNNN